MCFWLPCRYCPSAGLLCFLYVCTCEDLDGGDEERGIKRKNTPRRRQRSTSANKSKKQKKLELEDENEEEAEVESRDKGEGAPKVDEKTGFEEEKDGKVEVKVSEKKPAVNGQQPPTVQETTAEVAAPVIEV